MVDIRKILIIFVIGILYSIFVHSFVDAVYPAPEYEDYCKSYAEPKLIEKELEKCEPIEFPECEGGQYEYTYDSQGCPMSAVCSKCFEELRNVQKSYNGIYFILSSIFGLFAIALALYLPIKKNELNEWVGTGFMLGGLLSIFVGTATYYGDMTRLLRPFVILIELIIVIYLAYKKIKA